MRRIRGGFTLVEVMLALGILFAGLVVLIRSTAGNIRTAQHAQLMGAATELARGKMYDLESELLQEGFQELDETREGDFDAEGWPNIQWKAEIIKVELPEAQALDALQDGEGEEGGEEGGGGDSGGQGAFGGLMGMADGDASDMAGASFLSGQFGLMSQILEASIRKVVLTVTYEFGGDEWSFDVVAYFTDPAAINRTLIGGGGGGAVEDDPGEGGGGRGGGGRGGGGPVTPGGGGGR